MANIIQKDVKYVVKDNYLPYAMETILNRALPDIIDGLKPVHRKVVFQTYDNGWTNNKPYVKSSRIVGEVLKVHEHGDGSVYESACILTDNSKHLLYGLLDGHGAFGDIRSSDKAPAFRYTHMRTSAFTDKVVMGSYSKKLVPFYSDGEGEIPRYLPTMIPLILVKNNEGVACTIISNILSHNLIEVCEAVKLIIEDPNADLLTVLHEPDFSTGGYILRDRKQMQNLVETGRASFRLRAKYRIDENARTITFTDLPYGVTIERTSESINKLREKKSLAQAYILDVRDSTGYDKKNKKSEFSISIDVRKGTNYEALVSELFKKTELEGNVNSTLRVLDEKSPKLYGIRTVILRWLEYRRDYLRRQVELMVEEKSKSLIETQGLIVGLKNLDLTIDTIRKSKKNNVIQNLCIALGIDEVQANKLYHTKIGNLNEDDIDTFLQQESKIKAEIVALKNILTTENGVDTIIVKQLNSVMQEFGKDRQTQIVDIFEDKYEEAKEIIETKEIKNVRHIVTKEGYYKKVPLVSIKSTSKETLKDGDEVILELDGKSNDELLLFRKGEVERVFIDAEHKLSDYGEFLKADFIIPLVKDEVLITYENGYSARLPILETFNKKYKVLKMNEGIANVSVIGYNKYVRYFTNTKTLLTELSSDQYSLIKSRTAKGVKGMNVDEGDKIVKVELYKDIDSELESQVQKRGGKGIKL